MEQKQRWLKIYRRDLSIGNEGQIKRKWERLRRQYFAFYHQPIGWTDSQIGQFFAIEELITANNEATHG